MLPGNGYSSYGGNAYGLGSNFVYPSPAQQQGQYGMMQQYATPPITTPVSEPRDAIIVHGVEGARSFNVPKNSLIPLFDDEEDVFYIKTMEPDGMHQRIKKYRFYEEFNDDVVDTTAKMIEQKDLTYGDSNELNLIKKSIEDLKGEINALMELQLETSNSNQEKSNKIDNRNINNSKKNSNNKQGGAS